MIHVEQSVHSKCMRLDNNFRLKSMLTYSVDIWHAGSSLTLAQVLRSRSEVKVMVTDFTVTRLGYSKWEWTWKNQLRNRG